MSTTQEVIERRGDWMQTFSGGQFWPESPDYGDVKLLDIAHALSMLCRFGGHCRDFYSVAEHSVLVSQVVPPEFALQGLLHDATEAYCVDVPRPLKKALGWSYETIESGISFSIAVKFNLPFEMDESVKRADNDVLLAERDALFDREAAAWSIPGTPAPVQIRCLSPREAEMAFLRRFLEITQ
jgi:hypothetical protein